MKIALYAREYTSDPHKGIIKNLLASLASRSCNVFIPSIWKADINGKYSFYGPSEPLPADTDILIAIGGDGTILDTLTLMEADTIPVMGINAGRLGFLTSIIPELIPDAVEDLFKGAYEVEERSLLALHAENEIFGKQNLAINDFVIHKNDTGSMITIHTYLNGEFLNSYWADGLIISTPTGSTGYSLSCGGPILFPQSSSFVITPIAPHNLSVRPIVVADDTILSFEAEGRGNSFLLSLDSRSLSVPYGFSFAIQKSEKRFKTIQFSTNHFLKTLVKRLLWGADNRN